MLSDKGAKTTQWGQIKLFNKWCQGNWISTGKTKQNWSWIFTLYCIKIISKWIKIPKYKTWKYNNPKRKHRRQVSEYWIWKYFHGHDSKAQTTKAKRQIGLYQILIPACIKGNSHQKKKKMATCWLGENICKSCIWWGVNNSMNKPTNNLIKKWTKNLTIFQRRYVNAQAIWDVH